MRTGSRVGAWFAVVAAAAFLLASVVPWMKVAEGEAETHEFFTAVALTTAGLIWVFVSAVYLRRSGSAND